MSSAAHARGSGDDKDHLPMTYAARRIAWHALDHAWAMSDRGAP
jgi:hypothetical protein